MCQWLATHFMFWVWFILCSRCGSCFACVFSLVFVVYAKLGELHWSACLPSDLRDVMSGLVFSIFSHLCGFGLSSQQLR